MAPVRQLGKYQIVETLGKGAMGIVFKGFDPVVERHVALKTIRKEMLEDERGVEMGERFRKEAQAGGRLSHPNIVAVYEYGEAEDVAYIAMEYVEGRSLSRLLATQNRFELPDVMAIVGQLLEALGYAHDMEVVHRDIKPANLILTGNFALKIADFGIARMRGSQLTMRGAVLGSPGYMSPEQLQGKRADHRSDLFSVAVVLFELVTGKRPFEGDPYTVSMKVLNEAHRDPSAVVPGTVPLAFDGLLQTALAKDPEKRFQSAREFRDALMEAYDLRDGVNPNVEATVFGRAAVLTPPVVPPVIARKPALEWDARDLEAVSKLLALQVGPMARVFVKQASAEATTGYQLVTLLEEQIDDAEGRREFSVAALAKVGGIGA